PAKSLRPARIVDNAVAITIEGKTRQYADHSRRGYGNEHTKKTEELSPREQCEDHPHRMKMDAIANQLRCQNVGLDRLPENEDTADDRHFGPCLVLQCGESNR